MDRETVINHLQIIHTWAEFARERDLQFFTAKHLGNMAQWADDALNLLKEQQEQIDRLLEESASNAEMAEGYAELLKEQEAVEPVTESSVYDPDTWWFVCGSCKKGIISPGDEFCRWCGKPVLWEGR